MDQDAETAIRMTKYFMRTTMMKPPVSERTIIGWEVVGIVTTTHPDTARAGFYTLLSVCESDAIEYCRPLALVK